MKSKYTTGYSCLKGWMHWSETIETIEDRIKTLMKTKIHGVIKCLTIQIKWSFTNIY